VTRPGGTQHMTRDHSSGLSFAVATDPTGLRVLDPVDNHQYRLETPTPVAPEPAPTDRFTYPVDAATTVRTSAIRLPTAVNVYVRDETGALVASVEHLESASLAAGTYTLELLTPVKCYLKTTAALTVESDFGETRISFEGRPAITVGARSRRTQPATTVTTTTAPADLLATVSTFGAALGTTMPERSYPSLRGHPPAVELGDELDTRGLTPPADDVWLELPETTAAALTAAPLAYYLGAPVRAGETPCIVADGHRHPLTGPGADGFERAVERALKTLFFMDCCARYDGAYGRGRRLHERERVVGELGVDFAELYEADHAERVARSLAVPYRTIEPHLPQWKVAATARPTGESVELLPFLVADLALVRTADADGASAAASESSTQADAVASFLSGDGDADGARRGPAPPTADMDVLTRGPDDGGTRSAAGTRGLSFVSPEPAEALEQVWVGEGVPFGASEAVLAAYHNRLGREPGDGEIDITVVCNAAAMDEETAVESVYGQRDHLPFEVTLRRDLSTDQLRTLLADDHDFLHYIGHAEPDGLICEDGKLDCEALDGIGVESFLLNACRSYRQARALIEAGAIVGVGSHTDVANAGAVGLGRTMARLLEHGYPFAAALDLAREHHPVGEQYVVVGDGSLSVVQCNSGTALLCELETVGDDTAELTLYGSPTPTHDLGSSFMPFLNEAENTYYIPSGRIDSFELDRAAVAEFLNYQLLPVRFQGELFWSDGLDLSTLSSR
jgi:hypothetical protein